MTLAEYELRMESYELKIAKKRLDMATQAFFNANIQATDDDGKSVYDSFDDFYDYISAVNKVRSKYEPTYVPIKKAKKKSKTDILIDRIRAYQRKHPRKELTNGR